MIVFKEPLDGEHQWITGNKLTIHSDWHLVAMAEEEVFESYQEEVLGESSGGYSNKEYLQKQRPVRRVMFLIRKTHDKVLEELRARVDNAEETQRTTNIESFKASKRIPKLEKELEEIQGKLDSANERSQQNWEDRNEAERKLRKLERHLGAVRKEVGDARWREIIEEVES